MLNVTAPDVIPLERVKGVFLAMAKDAQVHREELKIVFAHSKTKPI